MATAEPLFANLTLTGNANDAPRTLPSNPDWMAVQLIVTAVSGTNPAATFHIQWSFDGASWSDANPQDLIGTATAPASVIQRFEVKAPYWRLVAAVTGTNPSFTLTGNALI
jgi:hypothetical protein